MSRPLWARGLKLQGDGGNDGPVTSRPLWERGLKPLYPRRNRGSVRTRPLRGP